MLTTSRLRSRALAALTLGLLLPGCTVFSGDATIRVSSTPAGAFIYVDGRDTGKTTPALLDMATVANFGGVFAGDRVVTVRKKGFEPEQRTVRHHTGFYTSKWVDGVTDFWFMSNPLFWTFGDMLFPFGARYQYVPHELHVKLYPEGEAPGIGK